MYAQESVSCPIDCLFHIRIIEYNVGTLASELQSNGFQVALCRGLHYLAADKGAAGECDLVDVHVLADGLSNGVSVTCNDVDDAGREACFVDQGGHPDGSQRREFGRLKLKDECMA